MTQETSTLTRSMALSETYQGSYLDTAAFGHPKVAYLGGPMTNYDKWNIPLFLSVDKILTRNGWKIYNPGQHDIDNGLDPDTYPELPEGWSLSGCLRWDLARIAEDAECVIFLPNWRHSTGSGKEYRVTRDVGKPVYEIIRIDALQRFVELRLVPEDEKPDAFIRHMDHVVGVRGTENGDPNKVQWTHTVGPQAPVKLPEGETRVVDAKTGGEKGSKLERTDLIPKDVLLSLSAHYGRGCAKYADRNWERGYKWSLSIAALERHLFAWESGQDLITDDPLFEGVSHLDAVVWHAMALRAFELRGIGTDDRGSADATQSGRADGNRVEGS